MKNSPSCVHALHKTLNVVILLRSFYVFAAEGKEMYQNVKRTCRAIFFFAHSTNCFAPLSLPSPSSLLKLSIVRCSKFSGRRFSWCSKIHCNQDNV